MNFETYKDTQIRAIVYCRRNTTWSGAFYLSTSAASVASLGSVTSRAEVRTACVFVGGYFATEQGAIHASLAAGRRAAVLLEQDL
jgi:hypothetical protein